MDAIEIIRFGNAKESEEYTRYAVCKYMHWDYYTFERQPEFFLNEIILFIRQEQEAIKNGG